MEFRVKRFDQLSPLELYQILQLRSRVFVLEQKCLFQDMDDKDQEAGVLHVMGYRDGQLMAYSRLLPAGKAFAEASIGRVVVHDAGRTQGLGRVLFAESIRVLRDSFGAQPIRIGAQTYLRNFYVKFGFVSVGEDYMEDGIPHVEMLLDNA